MSARKVPHILKLSAEEQKEFVNSFDVVMCDCDGVMWMATSPLPRTGEAANALKDDGKRVYFVSNNSERPEEEYVNKFTRIGVKDFQAVTKEDVEIATLDKITRPEQKMGAVLYDINLNLTYAQIAAATRYLADKDCQFIAGGTDWLLPMSKDLTLPGFCDFLDTIKRFSGREPTIVSKPAVLLGEILKDVYKLADPKRCLFVGDSLTHDVRFGLNCGFQTLLVLSGGAHIEEMWQASAENQPHFYADSIADFIELYANISKNT
ncbi:chronophin-like isoform X2 [Bactrocera dorsalis]|uniref:Chronophin-like isoform X2 n=1 Tax=Bactrocera dorsalis TaxID=27457 RepID=A0ABM3JT27_BACDO|nr:chronophin-like isoform X2 [Bactrocera dorsalis]